MSELSDFIEARIREHERARGLYWCPFCGHDHLDETADCPVLVNPPFRGIGGFLT